MYRAVIDYQCYIIAHYVLLQMLTTAAVILWYCYLE
jgi:hypothetical protein